MTARIWWAALGAASADHDDLHESSRNVLPFQRERVDYRAIRSEIRRIVGWIVNSN